MGPLLKCFPIICACFLFAISGVFTKGNMLIRDDEMPIPRAFSNNFSDSPLLIDLNDPPIFGYSPDSTENDFENVDKISDNVISSEEVVGDQVIQITTTERIKKFTALELSDLMDEVEEYVEGEELHLRFLREDNGKTIQTTDPSQAKTSYLLTSDTALDKNPFFDQEANTTNELGGEFPNITHENAISGKSLDKSVYVVPPITVDIGESTNLLLNPNTRQEIVFDVTNHLDSITPVNFHIKDDKGILLRASTLFATIAPQETTKVIITVLPKLGMGTNRISFLAVGVEQVRKEVLVDLKNDEVIYDKDYPLVDYKYTSDCTDVILSRCQEGTWTIQVKARDQDSGLALLTTIPRGLIFPNGYVSGTTDEITGYYSGTCCNPDLQIMATDRRNNRIVKQANAYKAPLSFWAILAIVFICLVILAMIAICVIYCVKKYWKKDEESYELPTYRGAVDTRF